MWSIILIRQAKKRAYISIYFEDGLIGNRKKRDLTISFSADDPLYKKCKDMSSTELKEAVGFSSYNELMKLAKKEDRALGNYVKHRLRQKLV